MAKAERPAETDKTKYGVRELRLLPKCEGFDVWELQIKLIGWGSGSDNDGVGNCMDPVRVTGTFDTTTRDAVMRFQKAYKLPITGIVDDGTFRAIDAQAALFPVQVYDLRCKCAKRKDDPDIVCRCKETHPEKGKCTGFGKKRFAGEFLTKDKKLADGTSLAGEKLDLYDMEEYEGIDKALLWAVRALMKRAEIERISVVSGYKCWHDNYLYTDDRHWRHRQITLNLGKAIEFIHAGRCATPGEEFEHRFFDTGEWTEIGRDWETKSECARCTEIRDIAVKKCGFQMRWQEPERLSLAQPDKKAAPPMTPFSVHLDTVRRVGRKKDDFVKTHFDSIQPQYPRLLSLSMPVDLDAGLDPRLVPAESYFRNTEVKKGGWYPYGGSRVWHGGVHLYQAAAKPVYAVAAGEVIACRVGEAEGAEAYGSRNFLLLRHEWKKKKWYSFYLHLDAGKADAATEIKWRKNLFAQTLDAVELKVPMPVFVKKKVVEKKTNDTTEEKDRLLPEKGFAAGSWVPTEGDEVDPKTIDDLAPDNSTVFLVKDKPDTYIYLKMENKAVAVRRLKTAGLDAKISGGKVIGLTNPISVGAGESVGAIAAAPTDPKMGAEGACIHIEIFAEEQLITGDGWTLLDAADVSKVADRKAVFEALAKEKLVAAFTDKVWLDPDMTAKGDDPYRWSLRSAVVKMPPAWSVDWKDALKAAAPLSFLKDSPRDALGEKFNKYSWWEEAKAGGLLPASAALFHFHPIAFLLHLAYQDPD